jgi:hypothetical protein
MNTSIFKGFLFIFCLLALFMQGCAVGNKYNFSDTRADLQISASRPIAVAVATLDQRELVATKERTPAYVGMQRAGLGNPWRVNTEGGPPLADDISTAVFESLAKKGFRAIPVYVTFNQPEDEALHALGEKKSDRSVLILLKKWESDTYVNIGLDYDLRLKIVDSNQAVLGETAAAERKTISGSFWDPPAAAKEQIPIAFKQGLEKLLNDPAILAALKE